MAFPLALIPAIIGAVSSIASTIANRRAEKKRAQQQFAYQQAENQQVFEQQKQLAAEQWEKQNAYNTPLAQMGRYSEAGLNPNLIYGQGNSGNASPMSTPNLQPAKFDQQLVPLNIPDMIGQYQNFQIRKAGLDRTQQQIALMNEQTRTQAVDRMNKLLKGESEVIKQRGEGIKQEHGQFDLELKKELRKYNVDIRKNESATARVRAAAVAKEFELLDQFGTAERKSRLKTQAIQQARQVAGTATEQEKLALMKTFSWTQGYQESAAKEAKVLSAQQQAIFDKLKTNMFREHSFTPSDNFFLRMLVHWMQSEGISAEEMGVPK